MLRMSGFGKQRGARVPTAKALELFSYYTRWDEGPRGNWVRAVRLGREAAVRAMAIGSSGELTVEKSGP